jgi:hypothetical protein
MTSLKSGYAELCGAGDIVGKGRVIYSEITNHANEDNTIYGNGNSAKAIVDGMEASR